MEKVQQQQQQQQQQSAAAAAAASINIQYLDNFLYVCCHR
jgi:hypothetical protein